MNGRSALRSIMERAGFAERSFKVLPDASLFWRIPYLRRLELGCWRVANSLGLYYPDSCILATYERTE
jgi:hypothetical protein